MPRKINVDRDKEILEYVKNHSWKETQAKFDISSRSIKMIKERNSNHEESESKVESKVAEKTIGVSKEKLKGLIEIYKKAAQFDDSFVGLISADDIDIVKYFEKVIE